MWILIEVRWEKWDFNFATWSPMFVFCTYINFKILFNKPNLLIMFISLYLCSSISHDSLAVRQPFIVCSGLSSNAGLIIDRAFSVFLSSTDAFVKASMRYLSRYAAFTRSSHNWKSSPAFLEKSVISIISYPQTFLRFLLLLPNSAMLLCIENCLRRNLCLVWCVTVLTQEELETFFWIINFTKAVRISRVEFSLLWSITAPFAASKTLQHLSCRLNCLTLRCPLVLKAMPEIIISSIVQEILALFWSWFSFQRQRDISRKKKLFPRLHRRRNLSFDLFSLSTPILYVS